MEYIYFLFTIFLEYLENNFFIVLFFYFLFMFCYNCFSLPGNLIIFGLSGYMFGVVLGFISSSLAVLCGSYIFFILSRFFLSKIFPNIYKKYSNKINYFISKSTLEYLIIFRIIPGPPIMLQNLCMSLTNISSYKFLLSTLIGVSPLVYIIVFVGNKMNDFNKLKNITINDVLTLDFLIFVGLIIILLFLRIYFRKKKKE